VYVPTAVRSSKAVRATGVFLLSICRGRIAGSILCAAVLSLLSSPPAHAATTGWQTVAPTYTRATVSYTVGVNSVKTVDYIGVSGRRKWIRDWEPSAGCVLEGWGVHALQVKNNGTTYISYPANTRPGYVNTDCGTYRTRYEVRPGFQGTNPSVYVSTTQWCPTGGSCSSWNAGITIGI
jgi:hypothetical protein